MRFKELCLGRYLLAIAFLAAIGFGSWLIVESDSEEMTRYRVELEEYILDGKREEAKAFLDEKLSSEGDGPLSLRWLPLIISSQSNGFEILGYYVRILAGSPGREATYEEISNLVEAAPQAFHDEMKPYYLADLKSVPNVRVDYLEKYGLVNEQEKKNTN